MLFLLPLGSGMEELVQHQPRDSFPDYKKRKPCLLLIWFGILRSNFPVGSIRFHPIPSILRLITRNRILSHWWYFLLNEKIGLVFLYPPATPVWEWFYINGEPPNKEVAPCGKAFLLPSLFLIFWARIHFGLRIHRIGTSIQNLKPLPTKKKVLERGFERTLKRRRMQRASLLSCD